MKKQQEIRLRDLEMDTRIRGFLQIHADFDFTIRYDEGYVSFSRKVQTKNIYGSFFMLSEYAIIENKKGASDEGYKYTVASGIYRGNESGA